MHPQSTPTLPDLHIITGAALGPQLHIGGAAALIPVDPAIENTPDRAYTVKPRYGFWTSTYRDNASAWVEWCRDNMWGDVDGGDRWWVLRPHTDAHLLMIDGARDFVSVLTAYGFPSITYEIDGCRALDFERMRDDGYAGLHLTEAGSEVLHFSSINGMGMNAWDCESTCWFRWAFIGEPFDVRGVEIAQKSATGTEKTPSP